jgi:hypothetical protein
VLGVRIDVGSRYGFPCTGPAERKAKNLAQNPNCVLTTDATGSMVWTSWSRVRLQRASDGPELRSVADTFESKYGRWLV